ncbi:MAG: PD-(D/E)XK nuclease superfamily protein [Syntrophorhabdaceae bacterium PtaU1.Bin034]|nr:MAG: PD-(D/E)XK nuclease superfamily protein [Syntrophorhabdaceae bacterium PtaU1.Bin034]
MSIQADSELTTDTAISITASVLLEYLFCPRFIYFMNCLCIDQNEDKRYKVQKGREIHEGKLRKNIDYLRSRIGCVAKETDVFMASHEHHIHGIVDEVLTLADGTMAPLDYKYAEYHDGVFKTQRYQSVFYGLLIRENYGREVNRGYVCYIRSKNLLKEVPIGARDFDELKKMIAEIVDITQKGFYPRRTKSRNSCIDCCYRNICV